MIRRTTAPGRARRTALQVSVETMERRELLSGAAAGLPKVAPVPAHVGTVSAATAGKVHAQALPLAVGAKTLVSNLARTALQEVGSNLAGTAIGLALEAIGIGGGDGAKIDKISSQLDGIEHQLGGISSQIDALQGQVAQLNAKMDQLTLNQAVSTLPLAQIKNAQFLFDFLLTHAKDPSAPAVRTTLLNYIGANLLDAPAKFEAAFHGLGHGTSLMKAYSNVARNSLFAYNQANGQPTDPFLIDTYSAPIQAAYQYFKDFEALAVNLVVEYDHAMHMKPLALAHANYFLTQTAIDDAATPVPITPHFVVDTRSGLILANTVFGAGGPPQLHGEAANALAQFLNVNTRSAGGNAYFAATVNLPAYQPKYLKNANVTQLGIDFLNTLADGAHGGTGDLPWRLPTEAELRGLVAGHTNGGGFAFLNLRWLHWAVWNDSTHAGQANAPWVWASDTRMASLPGLNQGKPFVEQAIVNLNNGSVAWVPIRALHYTNSSTIVPAPQAAVILVSNGGRNYFV